MSNYRDPDWLLGRTLSFRDSDGYTVQLREVTCIAWDPDKGVLLVGGGCEPTWVPSDVFMEAVEAEIFC